MSSDARGDGSALPWEGEALTVVDLRIRGSITNDDDRGESPLMSVSPKPRPRGVPRDSEGDEVPADGRPSTGAGETERGVGT